jgi:hypothetical protein
MTVNVQLPVAVNVLPGCSIIVVVFYCEDVLVEWKVCLSIRISIKLLTRALEEMPPTRKYVVLSKGSRPGFIAAVLPERLRMAICGTSLALYYVSQSPMCA